MQYISKKLTKLISGLVLSSFFLWPAYHANAEDAGGILGGLGGDWESIAKLALGDGLPMGGNSKYTWIDVNSDVKTLVFCQTSAASPSIGDTGTAFCIFTPRNTSQYKFKAVPNFVALPMEFTEEGKQSFSLGPVEIRPVQQLQSNGKWGPVQDGNAPYGQSIAQINTVVYSGANSTSEDESMYTQPLAPIESNLDSSANNLASRAAITNDSSDNGTLDSLLDSGVAPGELKFNDATNDSSSFAAYSPEIIGGDYSDDSKYQAVQGSFELNPNATSNDNNGLAAVTPTDSSLLNGDNGTGLNGGSLDSPDLGEFNGVIADNTSKSDPLNSSSSGYNGSGSSYGDYMDRALGDLADAFNSSDDDWTNSNNGNTGESLLDDYFNGVEYDNQDIPGGLTNDLLGVGDAIFTEEAVDNLVERYGEDGEELPEGGLLASVDENGFVAYGANEQAPEGGFNSQDDGVFGLVDLASAYQDGIAGLDGLRNNNGMNSSNNNLLGNIDGNNQSNLSKRLRQLIGGDDSAIAAAATASDQELFDMAKQMLLSNGLNLDDIRRGRNYSPNSAWTDPTLAWDFNRIPSLLRRHRINLTNANRDTTGQARATNRGK